MLPAAASRLRHLRRHSHSVSEATIVLLLPRFFRPISSETLNTYVDTESAVQALSSELSKNRDEDAGIISQNLKLRFSHISSSITPDLILRSLNASPSAGRAMLGFHRWIVDESRFVQTDETVSLFIDYFGRNKDIKAVYEIIANNKGVVGSRCFAAMVDRLVRAGKPKRVVEFFKKMETDYGFTRDKDSLFLVVNKLCDHGFARTAENLVRDFADEYFPDERFCDVLIKGWCLAGKLEEARRLGREMYNGGFELGILAYNSIVDCVCKLCRRRDPFKLDSEVEKVLVEMDKRGVPRNVETFNILISNLCKLRRTQDALEVFNKMTQWSCHPNATTFLVLIRSLYQAARVGEGDAMIAEMKNSGYGDGLDVKAYYGFLKILCGIERLEHATVVFNMMKGDGHKPGIKTYDLLIGKLCACNKLDAADALYKEASENGVPVTPTEYTIDPRFVDKVKKEKKRETLPQKIARRRRRLKRIRLSFVKKPSRGVRGAI